MAIWQCVPRRRAGVREGLLNLVRDRGTHKSEDAFVLTYDDDDDDEAT